MRPHNRGLSIVRNRPQRLNQGAAASLIRNNAALASYRTAVTNRASAPVPIVYIGDSWGEGMNVATYGQRMVDLIVTNLQTAYPTTGATGIGGSTYLPADYSSPQLMHSYTSLLGGFGGGVNAGGFGRRQFIFATIGQGARYTRTCTDLDIFWFNIAGAGTLRVVIDGGAPLDIATSGGTANAWNKTTITGLSDASHTIDVTCQVVGTAVIFGGMNVYRGNRTKGFHMIEASRQASDSTHDNGGDNQLALVSPALIILAYSINDYNAQTVTATYKTNLTNRMAKLRTDASNASVPILLLGYNAPNNLGARTPAYSTLLTAMAELSDADATKTAFLDISGTLPSAAADVSHTYWDNVIDTDLHLKLSLIHI